MNSSDFWDNSNHGETSSHHSVQLQEAIPQNELYDSISNDQADLTHYEDEDNSYQFGHEDNISGSMNISNGSASRRDLNNTRTMEQPSLEQIQKVYYMKGIKELESLQLLDLSPLANWKLSSSKPGFGLSQLRDDSPDTFWQSDGSNGNNNNNAANTNVNNELTSPHSVTIQFSKKVSIERISLFTNFSIDESYTPSKIQILAGSSDGWDLREVCLVSFNKPIGWSHIIFNGIRGDGVLKCFIIKLVILSNHQDGKDTHIRAIKVFGKKIPGKVQKLQNISGNTHGVGISNEEILKDYSGLESSGISLNGKDVHSKEIIDNEDEAVIALKNVNEIIGFNSGFQSLQLKSTSSIR